jgi:primosomal protein N'
MQTNETRARLALVFASRRGGLFYWARSVRADNWPTRLKYRTCELVLTVDTPIERARCEECGEFIDEGDICDRCAQEDAAIEHRIDEALGDPAYDPNEPWSDRAEQEINAREDRRYDE